MPDPSISALIPSRRRLAPLAESVASLRDCADHPERLEILVAADPDDPATADAARELGAHVHVAPERYGYHQLHRYINELAHQASGAWLLLWNDDARMLTPGWDARVGECQPGVLWPAHNDSPALNVFPVAHRRLVELIGHFSLSPHCDSWVQDVAEAAGMHRRIDVQVLHDRKDLTGGHDDEVYREAQQGYRTSEYHSPPMVEARQRDVDILRKDWNAV